MIPEKFMLMSSLLSSRIPNSLWNSLNLSRSATNMSQGQCTNGRDSIAKRLGVKKYGAEHVKISNILIKQRGRKYLPGLNVGIGGDDTLYSLIDGVVQFTKDKISHKTTVNVIPYPLKGPRVLDLKAVNI